MFDISGDSPPWTQQSDEFYVRDVSGKEIAIYSGSSLTQWNIWGLDNIGKINADTTRNYYLKDHLGSIRVVLNSTNGVVSAQDYDAWGYQLENRSYNSTAMRYDFTGKERDNETSYDYFGARYYDSRIGRWGGIEPLLEKYLNITPYSYSINNPINTFDPNGKDPIREQLGSLQDVVNILNQNEGKDYWEISEAFGSNVGRYIYTEEAGFIDMQHFFAAAFTASEGGYSIAILMGQFKEYQQDLIGHPSAWDPEDLSSNKVGAEFGSTIAPNRYSLDIETFKNFITSLKPVDPNDASIARDKLYIPEKEGDPSLPQKGNDEPYRGESPDYGEKNENKIKPNNLMRSN